MMIQAVLSLRYGNHNNNKCAIYYTVDINILDKGNICQIKAIWKKKSLRIKPMWSYIRQSMQIEANLSDTGLSLAIDH